MFDLVTILDIYLWLSVVVIGAIFLICVPNAERGMKLLDHEQAQLPKIMRGRYAGMFLFSLFAVWYGDLQVILAWLAVMGFYALYDAFTYFRSGGKYITHLIPAVFVALGLVLIVLVMTRS